MPLVHEGMVLETAYRLDIVIDEEAIVELKSVEAISEVHHNNLLTHVTQRTIEHPFQRAE